MKLNYYKWVDRICYYIWGETGRRYNKEKTEDDKGFILSNKNNS